MERKIQKIEKSTTDEISGSNVINHSKITLSGNCLSLLSDGLNVCMFKEFIETQFVIDFRKSFHNLSQHKRANHLKILRLI